MKRAQGHTGFALVAVAQRGRFQRNGDEDEYEEVAAARDAEFHFIRLEYTDLPQYHRGFGFSGSRMARCVRQSFCPTRPISSPPK